MPRAVAETQERRALVQARESEHPAALEVRVFHSDGSPGVGVRMLLSIADEELSRELHWGAAVEADGVARFSEVPPGVSILGSDRSSGRVKLALEPGERRELRYDLAAGAHVRGQVVRADGAPAPGAQVWLRPSAGNPSAAQIGPVADAAGWFELVDLGERCAVAARAEGQGPSAQVDLEHMAIGDDGSLEVLLRLTEACARVSGLVVDADGVPLAEVLVWIGSRPTRSDPDRLLTTGVDGLFDARLTCAPGLHVVNVTAPGHAVWREQFELVAGDAHELDVILERSATLRGRVLDAAGEPVEGAAIAYGQQPLEGYLQMNHWVRQDVPSPEATSDAEGRFRLGGLPAGLQRIQAKGASARQGTAELRVELLAGQTYEFDVQLDLGRVIRGQVLDLLGEPVVGVRVRASAESGVETTRGDSTDIEGRFLLTSLGGDSYRVEVRKPDFVTLVEARNGVRPDGKALRFEIDRVGEAPGRIAGSLPEWVIEEYRPLRVTMWREGDSLGTFAEVDAATGEFEGWPLQPGTYRIRVAQDHDLLHQVERIELESGTRVDLGRLQVEGFGAVAVALPDAAPEGTYMWLRAPEGPFTVSLEVSGKTALNERVLPGEYTLGGEWPGAWIEPMTVRVPSAGRAEVRLVLQESHQVYIALLGTQDLGGELTVRAVGPDTGPFVDQSEHRDQILDRMKNRPDGAWMFTGQLPRGRYLLQVRGSEPDAPVLLEETLEIDGPVVPEALPEYRLAD